MPEPRTPMWEEWFPSFKLTATNEVALDVEIGIENLEITEPLTVEERQQRAVNTATDKIRLAV